MVEPKRGRTYLARSLSLLYRVERYIAALYGVDIDTPATTRAAPPPPHQKNADDHHRGSPPPRQIFVDLLEPLPAIQQVGSPFRITTDTDSLGTITWISSGRMRVKLELEPAAVSFQKTKLSPRTLPCPVCELILTMGVLTEQPPSNCWNCGKVWVVENGRVVKAGR